MRKKSLDLWACRAISTTASSSPPTTIPCLFTYFPPSILKNDPKTLSEFLETSSRSKEAASGRSTGQTTSTNSWYCWTNGQQDYHERQKAGTLGYSLPLNQVQIACHRPIFVFNSSHTGSLLHSHSVTNTPISGLVSCREWRRRRPAMLTPFLLRRLDWLVPRGICG